MKKIIEKYKMKYPRWLFVWLIKKHWLYPEPMVFSDRLYISESISMQLSGREYGYEIKKRLIASLWDTIEKVWLKYSYTPSIPEIDFTRHEDFQTMATVLTWKIVCTYSPSRNFNYVLDLMKEIEQFLREKKNEREGGVINYERRNITKDV